MRLSIALNFAFALGLMGPCEAFTSLAAFLRQPVKLQVGNFGPGAGWDNDDFLNSLSKPNEQLPIENDIQELEGTLPPVQPYKGEHDDNQGGSRFKAMMAAAQQAKTAEPISRGQPPVNPYAANPFVPPAAYSNAPLHPPLTIDPADAEKLSVEEQAALFRKMMEQRQTPAKSYEPPPPGIPTKIGGLDAKGRRIGRNRDTDTIANTSDLYFAQLKRDSSVRNMARIQGDEEFADKVFEDPSVKQLEVELKENPYLQKEKEENQEMFQAMAKELQQFQIRQAANQPDVKDTGPKYKELMAQKKAKKSGGAIPSPPPAVVATPAPAPVVSETAVSAPVPVPAPVFAQVPAPVPAPPPVVAAVSVPEPVPVAAVPTPAVAVVPAQVSEPMEETELTKRKIRELQGLFLKHRGGPGFGSGRLRGNEVEQFEVTLKAVGAQLRADAGPRTEAASSVPAPAPVVTQPIAAAVPAPAPIPSPPPVISRPEVEAHAPLITPPPRPDTSAMTTFTSGSVDPRLQGSLACVEGALQMYKNCSPEIQQGMLMALRAALLSAANSCQQVIEGTVDQTSYAAPPSTPPQQPAFVSTVGAQDATIEESGEELVVVGAPVQDVMPSGNDSNSVLLRKVYDSLSAASGGGKFGLGPISAGEADDIADLVMDMRVILMEELDSGIPDGDDSPVESPSSNTIEPPPISGSSGGTSSTYQKMLAKARAAKKQS